MRRFLTLVLISCLLIVNTQCGVAWKEYEFGDYCTLSLPNSMELRDTSSAYGSVINKGVQRFLINFGGDYAINRIVFQPKGLNSDDQEIVKTADELYSRVIVELLPSNGQTQSDIDNMSASDISQLNTYAYNKYLADIKMIIRSTGMKEKYLSIRDFQWSPLKIEKYSGKNALVIHYIRPGMECFVNVTEYDFLVRGKQLRITISYKESEKDIWADDFAKIISTIKFK